MKLKLHHYFVSNLVLQENLAGFFYIAKKKICI